MTQDIETDQQGKVPSEEDIEVFTNQTSEEEVDGHEEVKVAQDHELKVLPENEEEDKEEILITDATKRPTTSRTKKENKKQKEVQKGGKGKGKGGKALPNNITRILNRQTGEIDKMALQLSSIAKQLKLVKNQSDSVKHLQPQLRQIQKQMSQIQKGIRTNKQVSTSKKKKIE
jgi:hypothetical protein